MQDLFHFYEGTMSSEMAPSKQALDLVQTLLGRFLDTNSKESSLEVEKGQRRNTGMLIYLRIFGHLQNVQPHKSRLFSKGGTQLIPIHHR